MSVKKNRADKSTEPADITLQYYADHADTFIDATFDADMRPARNRFLERLPAGAYILDFGCGSGRDAKAFLESGFRVDAVDGSAELCRLASGITGISVRQMLFQELSAVELYEGIWACSSILHLPEQELRNVLHKITAALKPGGILYTSFKYGNFAGIRNGRYFTDFTEETLREFWKEFPSLKITELWITPDVRPGRENERWINLLAGKET
ncbi:MAG: class I SAM-dependent methyltransferase [Eubacteriales bacterium]|nr:class I SAM-dependent methyltransferase [Eubacteriales bacterium]